MHMSDVDRRCFFEHMGHSEAVSRQNYQCPAGMRELKVMGRLLGDLDGKGSVVTTEVIV